MFDKEPEILTVRDLCRLLHICRNTAYGLLNNGEIPAIMIAGTYKIRKRDLISFLEKSFND